MTTTRGFLQKADPATLDDDIQQLLHTWSEKAYDDHNNAANDS